ncbi:NosD domain-containing protein [Haloarcula argentinensis]|uniref:Right-handed parallel beta-helix repeat-containing protein n=1 Tax=Haloarcula argentinensis TaxID=43776 RepID=A0ABU2F5M8_HALAR|nr:NosD domain-containing protein [Haloarcula argentinensis]EMA26484.1 copper-binding protein [Haloarcula argentinensis DSM 12282]MDS0255326.1 right-handed parallel beta-helix repeat-containing protein [Haloarcula argentinensis]
MRPALTTVQLFAILAVVLGTMVFAASFAIDTTSARPEPVAFDNTVQRGITMADEQIARNRSISVPRAQVFYSQYRYVVGYVGISQAVTALTEPGHEQQFGYPLVVYVSDYSDRPVRCGDDGSLRTATPPDWVEANQAHYVVDGAARVPSGPAVVPFADRDDADAFADSCGGRVIDWEALKSHSFDLEQAAAVREQVGPRRNDTNATVQAARQRRNRPVSVEVGTDAPTVQAAVDAAPPNTTVVVPTGTYEEQVTIDKPLTLSGPGATLDGGGNGTVVTVTADRVGVTGFDIVGVGNTTVGDPTQSNDSAWDATVTTAYGNSDAAVTGRNASGLYVANLSVETPASGVVLRRTPGAVVENSTVNGTADWQDGFMGVIGMHGSIVVQDSVFNGGRDGVYLHRADGTAVRNNTFRDNRFGVHLMYTSRALVADNVARGQEYAGVVVMTNPMANAIVGNDVRHSGSGVMLAGSRSYIAHNVVVDTTQAMSTNADRSLYEHNVLYGNDIGVRASTVVPSNIVTKNDFIANDRHAISGPGPLRVYTHEGRGNYWSGAYDLTGGTGPTLGQSYSPTDSVDRRLHQTDAAVVLRSAPSVRGLRALRGTTPGFRRGTIVDRAPLTDPANPGAVERLRNETAMEEPA